MKHTHLIVILCLFFSALFQFKLHAQDTRASANVTIGRQGADCRGRGICNFNMSTRNQGNTTVIFNGNASITLIINSMILSEDSRSKLVTTSNKSGPYNLQTFEMEAAFELSGSLAHALNVSNAALTIPKGTYPMQIQGNNYIITFKLE